MRVLQVIPSLAEVHGGPSVAVRMIERALADQGVEVETATTDDDGPGRRLGRQASAVEQGHARRHYFAKHLEFYKIAPGFVFWALRRLRTYDVIHIHALFSFTSVVAALVARWLGVPYIVRPLGVLNHYGLAMRRPLLKGLSLRFVEGPILKHAAAVHFTACEEQREALLTGLAMKAVVLPLGVDAPVGGDRQRFLAAHPELDNKVKVLFLSRIDPKKNLEGLITAVALLCAEGLPVRLIVAGAGAQTYLASLRRLAEEQAVTERICWLGQVSGQDKSDVLAAADVFALPSFSENFGIAAVEAMACGLPCVLGEGVALATTVQGAGAGVVVATDGFAIANGLREFVVSTERRAQAGAAAQALASREYSVATMGRRLVELYRDVVR